FVFQAEDGIRDRNVTGVQTCALPIYIHTEYPGNVMTLGQTYGSLTNMKIENMREQHEAIVREKTLVESHRQEKSDYAIVTVTLEIGRASCRERVAMWVLGEV